MPDDVDAVRDWTGSEPSDDDIVAVLDRDGVGSPEAAALSILLRRRADLAAGFSSFAVAGDVAWSRSGDAVKALDGLIARLEALLGVASSSGLPLLTTAPIVARGGTRI